MKRGDWSGRIERTKGGGYGRKVAEDFLQIEARFVAFAEMYSSCGMLARFFSLGLEGVGGFSRM